MTQRTGYRWFAIVPALLHRSAGVAFLISLFYVPLLPRAMAQTVFTGELTGTVTDQSGVVIQNAKVELTSEATGQESTVTTNSTGEFRFPLLRPGIYAVVVSAVGFENGKQQTRAGLGQSSNLNIQLGIATKKEHVTVTEQSPLLQTNTANFDLRLTRRN